MKVWTIAAATLTLLTGLAIGAAVAPVAYGQTKKSLTWAEPVKVQLLRGGARLGVSIRDIEDDDAKRGKMPGAGGVVIEEVVEDSPAQKAGFKVGDIVVEFDGERVRSARQFTRLVQETPAERDVQAIVMRDGQRTTLTVRTQASDAFNVYPEVFERLRVLPTPPTPPSPPAVPRVDGFPHLERFFGSSGRLGITVDTLSDQLADYFGTKDGVLVTSVTLNSAAGKAGLKAGDVITSVNGSRVSSTSDVTRQISRLDDGGEFTLEIVRDKKPMTLKGKLESRQSRRWTSII